MVPGATTGDVFRAAGVSVLGRMLGHGVGLAGQEPPYITEQEMGSGRKLESGMVFSVEPYVSIPGADIGFRLEEHVVITDNGPVVYSTFPHGPLSEQ
jgi:Xaa-Pro aminopeptidase